jgi:exoribonuclease II
MSKQLANSEKYAGMLVEYLDDGRLRAALATREQGDHVTVADASGNERRIPRELILVRHPDRRASRDNVKEALAALNVERGRLGTEVDLNLLWEIVHDDERGYTAAALAETFFGRSSPVEVAVMLEALLGDRLYFIRRHMEFVARDPDQVERLRTQYEKIRLRSEGGQQTRRLLSGILDGGPLPPREDAIPLIAELTRYLENPFARSRETAAMLEAVAGDLASAEAAYEILARLNARPAGSRFALIGGLRTTFSEAAQQEALNLSAPERPSAEPHWAVTIDDEETVEIDDALSCEALADGELRVRVHIALVADFIAKGGPMDADAAARGTTVYLPETTIRMLPDPVSTVAASLTAGATRHVLTTDVRLSATGELRGYTIALEQIKVGARLTYDEADRILLGGARDTEAASFEVLNRLRDAANRLREGRLAAGAHLIQRREPKITVVGDMIEIKIIDSSSPSRELVAECMVLSNHIAARIAADRNIPMIFRVQPQAGEEAFAQRARLSLYPGFHAGVGLDGYVQASSPIRRYVDLVLQRQLVAMVGGGSSAYDRDALMAVLAAAESTEAEGRELERRAKRYWTLTYLQRSGMEEPLEATVLRDGASAELIAYATRGALRGAPNLPARARIMVRVTRVDPLRGWLTLNYVETVATAEEGVP